MIGFDEPPIPHQFAKAMKNLSASQDREFPETARQDAKVWNLPEALVVSPDQGIHLQLAEALCQCGFVSVLASTVAETRKALALHQVCMVLCVERLPDGNYQAIVEFAKRVDVNMPIIVVSLTGDWPEYLKAMCNGAFDYLAYPPIPGELPRTIRNAILQRLRRQLPEDFGRP